MAVLNSNSSVHDAPCPYCKQAEEEQAAQANHDRQVQLQETKIKRLDLLIQLEEKKIIVAREKHEYQLKILDIDKRIARENSGY